MNDHFRIIVERHRNLVHMTLKGFFDTADVNRFVTARNEAHQLLTCGPNQHVTLVDMRDMAIQSQEVVRCFQAVLNNPAMASRRLSFVVAQSLARQQIRRAAEERDARYFVDEQSARKWLFAAGMWQMEDRCAASELNDGYLPSIRPSSVSQARPRQIFARV